MAKTLLKKCAISLGLIFHQIALSASIPLSAAVQFNTENQTWKSTGVSIKNMSYIANMVSIGEYSFAFGCENSASCQEAKKTGRTQLFSFYSPESRIWNTAQSIQYMDTIFSFMFYPVSQDSPDGSSFWILGSNPQQILLSYFDKDHFYPARPLPVAKFYGDSASIPLVVSHHYLWFIDAKSHRAFWTKNVTWNEIQSLPSQSSEFVNIVTDHTSDDIYVLDFNGSIFHLLPDSNTWSLPIFFPLKTALTDIRVMNNGKIISILRGNHIFVSQNGGTTWVDTGDIGSFHPRDFTELDQGNKKSIFWFVENNTLHYLDSSDPNLKWINLTMPFKPPHSEYQLNISFDGRQAWLYGSDKTDKFHVFYYDLNVKRFISVGLPSQTNSIYLLQSSGNGKAFAAQYHGSTLVGLYYDGEKWNSTELPSIGSDPNFVKLSYLPYSFVPMAGYNFFRKTVDPRFNTVWMYN